MSNARCTDCRYYPHTRFCTLADKHIRDARRVRFCEAFATNRTGPFQDGLRVVFDIREILAASVIDGQFNVLVGALAVGLPALISTQFRVYVVLNGRLSLLDAEDSFGWTRHYEALADSLGVKPVGMSWTWPGQ